MAEEKCPDKCPVKLLKKLFEAGLTHGEAKIKWTDGNIVLIEEIEIENKISAGK